MGHIETAVAMYSAGEVLHLHFLTHQQGSEDEKARKRSIIIPLVVTTIFGIETALKALVALHGGNVTRTHNLLDLYKILPVAVQERINQRSVTAGGQNTTVEALLALHQKSFQQWRYAGDFGQSLVVDLGAIRAALRAIIETHTEYYGRAATEKAQTVKDQQGVPQSIKDAASQYMRGLSGTSQ